jgi:hypothetical protein
MKHHLARLLSLALLAVAVAAPLTVSAQIKSLRARENNEGQVRVSVTPESLSKTADTWRFAVQLNTHVTPLTQDLMAVASLSDGKGAGEKPVAWEGDPPGGHHRKGVLVFKPLTPTPPAITLDIREVGGIADRTFTWNLSSP